MEWLKNRFAKQTAKKGFDMAVQQLMETDTNAQQIDFLLASPEMQSDIKLLEQMTSQGASKEEFIKVYERMGPKKASFAIAIITAHDLDTKPKSD